VPAGWAVAGADASPPLQQISELRALSDTVIVLEIEMLKKDLLLLNVKKATKQDVKCHQFVVLRKKVAMLKTIRRERELEQGIKKRESRRIDKSKRMISTFW
jgi:large subunit ribosomal protein L29